MIGADYKFNDETKVMLKYVEQMENLQDVTMVLVIMELNYQGYNFKVPVFGCTNDNIRGQALTTGLFCLSNVLAYWGLKRYQSKEENSKRFKAQKYQVAFGFFNKGINKLKEFIKSNAIWLERNRKMEEKSNGLIIIDAYYGLDEHIYQIDAGLLQVVDLKKITID